MLIFSHFRRKAAASLAVPLLAIGLVSGCGDSDGGSASEFCGAINPAAVELSRIEGVMQQLGTAQENDGFIMNDLESLEQLQERTKLRWKKVQELSVEVDALRATLNSVMPASYSSLLTEYSKLSDISTQRDEIAEKLSSKLRKDCQVNFDLLRVYDFSSLCPPSLCPSP